MKRVLTFLLFLILVIAMVSPILAQDWQGKSGIGIRGPFICPLFVGKDFPGNGGKEPFMMGWDGQFYLRYGLTNHWVSDLAVGLATSYDDSTATSSQSFSLNKKDNAAYTLNGLLTSLTFNYYFWPEKKMQPYMILGVGVDSWSVKSRINNEINHITDFSGKAGAGMNYWFKENFTIDFQARLTYALANIGNDVSSGLVNPNGFGKWKTRPFRGYIEPSIGLTYYLGGDKDTDKDGVSDKKDQCPDTPSGCLVDKVGCPLDSDGDDVCDGNDKCPDTPAGCLVDALGCPMDSDQDGVFDGIDKCPNTKKGCLVDARGCPLDADGDGVCDGIDECPGTPKGAKVDVKGCPMDTDGDGVFDGIDRCPSTPKGTEVDANGCPKNVKAPVQKITLNIKYATNSYEPDAASKKVLDDLAETMKAYTGVKLEINGFTDDVGNEKANQTLSEKRAGAVMEYLIQKGVDANRMASIGRGEDPQYFIGDNKTAEGRQMNRRVELNSTEFEVK